MSETITMDQAGRIVLPKLLRERFRLEGGARLRVEMVGDHLELTPMETAEAPAIVRKKGLLMVSASGDPCDSAAAARADREEREDHLTRPGRRTR